MSWRHNTLANVFFPPPTSTQAARNKSPQRCVQRPNECRPTKAGRRRLTLTREGRRSGRKSSSVPGLAVEPLSTVGSLPSPWSWFPTAGRKKLLFPRLEARITQSTERCAGAAEKPVCAGKRRRSRRRRGSIHGRAGLARCEITSGGGTRCSGREKAKESQWKRKRGGGGGDKREREGEKQRVSSL